MFPVHPPIPCKFLAQRKRWQLRGSFSINKTWLISCLCAHRPRKFLFAWETLPKATTILTPSDLLPAGQVFRITACLAIRGAAIIYQFFTCLCFTISLLLSTYEGHRDYIYNLPFLFFPFSVSLDWGFFRSHHATLCSVFFTSGKCPSCPLSPLHELLSSTGRTISNTKRGRVQLHEQSWNSLQSAMIL